jgi:demethylmenaquinone methyltransferase/2-methoxy-6-polyprenyl-1,4-benzoquinol methylase
MMVARKLELQRRYDLTAHMYDQRYEEIQRRKYAAVLASIPRARRILDLGCGTGILLKMLSKRCEVVVGVDASAGMLKLARRHATTLVQADADHLPFADGAFDAAVSVTLLQNMPDPSATMRELARVVSSGGIIAVTTLKHKHRPEQLTEWVTAARLKLLSVGEIPGSEDLICIARR